MMDTGFLSQKTITGVKQMQIQIYKSFAEWCKETLKESMKSIEVNGAHLGLPGLESQEDAEDIFFHFDEEIFLTVALFAKDESYTSPWHYIIQKKGLSHVDNLRSFRNLLLFLAIEIEVKELVRRRDRN
jgi:hypothetical protein